MLSFRPKFATVIAPVRELVLSWSNPDRVDSNKSHGAPPQTRYDVQATKIPARVPGADAKGQNPATLCCEPRQANVRGAIIPRQSRRKADVPAPESVGGLAR